LIRRATRSAALHRLADLAGSQKAIGEYKIDGQKLFFLNAEQKRSYSVGPWP
jgi:ABC-type tungstate transport system permease subunit